MTEKQYEEMVKASPNVLVVLGSMGCGHCVATKAALPEYRRLMPGTPAHFVDIDTSPEVADRLKVRMVPTIALYCNGRLTRKVTGQRDSEGLAVIAGRCISRRERKG